MAIRISLLMVLVSPLSMRLSWEGATPIRSAITKKISSIIELLKITAHVDELAPQTDRIHLANGTLFLDGRFTHEKDEIVRSRFPVRYTPDAAPPAVWLRFLDELLYAEDIPCLQEYIGYCLIPSNKGQRMMLIKGSGGEGKSQIYGFGWICRTKSKQNHQF